MVDLSALEVEPFIFKRYFSHRMTPPGREISKTLEEELFFYIIQDWGWGGGLKDVSEGEVKLSLF